MGFGTGILRGGLGGGLHVDAASASDGFAEDPLDLSVDAAKVVGRPALQLTPERRVDAEEE
jgi:hypothetical protein